MASIARCQCGHVWDLNDLSVYRQGQRRTINRSCPDCGREVAITESVEDLDQPITSSETIELHRLLEQDKTLEELTD